MRSRPEWTGKTDDSMPSPTVRLRIFREHNGTCHLCGTKIQVGQKWDASHVKSIWDGGENKETNLAPAHKKCHRAHTAQENTEQADANRKAMKHLGIKTQAFHPSRPQLHTCTTTEHCHWHDR